MQRREFLGTLAALTAARTVPAASSEPAREWHALRYAAETGDFVSAVGDDPVEQLHFARAVGYRGFLDPGWLQRPAFEQDRIAQAARDVGLTLGPCIGPCVPGDWWRDADLAGWQRDVRVAVRRCRDAGLTGLRFPVGPASILAEMASLVTRTSEVVTRLEACLTDSTFALILEPWQDARPCPCNLTLWSAALRTRTASIGLTLDFDRWRDPEAISTLIGLAGSPFVQHVELGRVCDPAATSLSPDQTDRVLERLEQRGYAGLIGLRRFTSAQEQA